MKTIVLAKKELHIGNLIVINAKLLLASFHNKELISADEQYTNILMEREAATVLSYILRDMNGKNEDGYIITMWR